MEFIRIGAATALLFMLAQTAEGQFWKRKTAPEAGGFEQALLAYKNQDYTEAEQLSAMWKFGQLIGR